MSSSQKAIIFDRDNTLTRVELAATKKRIAHYLSLAPSLSGELIAAHWAGWTRVWPRTKDEELDFWWAFWRTLTAQHGLPDSTVYELQAQSVTYHTDFDAFPDVVDSICALHAQGWNLAVLTNFKLPSVDLTLQSAGIDPSWFTVLLSSGMLGISKPDPRAYLAAAAALDLPASACVFVDDLLHNVEGACAVGMRGIWIDRQCKDVQVSFERIADLHDLISLLSGCQDVLGASYV